jgi:hypothetical protein
LGTLLYRLKTLSDERWHALLSWLAAQGIAQEIPSAPFPTPVVFVDGTGVGFNTPFYAQFRRGGRDTAHSLAPEGGGAGVLAWGSAVGDWGVV